MTLSIILISTDVIPIGLNSSIIFPYSSSFSLLYINIYLAVLAGLCITGISFLLMNSYKIFVIFMQMFYVIYVVFYSNYSLLSYLSFIIIFSIYV